EEAKYRLAERSRDVHGAAAAADHPLAHRQAGDQRFQPPGRIADDRHAAQLLEHCVRLVVVAGMKRVARIARRPEEHEGRASFDVQPAYEPHHALEGPATPRLARADVNSDRRTDAAIVDRGFGAGALL